MDSSSFSSSSSSFVMVRATSVSLLDVRDPILLWRIAFTLLLLSGLYLVLCKPRGAVQRLASATNPFVRLSDHLKHI
jgi:hypothetical protein